MGSESDWIKLHRKALDSRVFSDDWLWRLWCWCLLRARWKGDWKDGRAIKPGQFVCGRNQSADQLNVSPSKWYRGIQKLAEWGQITVEANNAFTVITICNWETYQYPKEAMRTTSEQRMNNQRTTDEQPADTKEERKKVKKGENVDLIGAIEISFQEIDAKLVASAVNACVRRWRRSVPAGDLLLVAGARCLVETGALAESEFAECAEAIERNAPDGVGGYFRTCIGNLRDADGRLLDQRLMQAKSALEKAR